SCGKCRSSLAISMSPRAAQPMRRRGRLLRYHFAAPNIDTVGLQRAIRFLECADNCNMRARLEFILIASHISTDDSIGRHYNFLFTILVSDHHHLAIDTGDRLVDGTVGHRTVRPGVPRSMTLTQSALRFGQNRHLDCTLAPIRLWHGTDADIRAWLDIGERRLGDAEYCRVRGETDLHLSELVRFDRQYMTVETLDHAGDAHSLLLRPGATAK